MIKYATALLPQAAAFCPQLLISLLSSLPLLICWRPRHEPPLQLEAACHEVSLPRPSPCSVRVHSGLAWEIVSIMFSSPVFDLVLVLEDPHSSRSCFRRRGHSVEATRQSRNNCACGKSQAGADWYCEPRSLAPRPTLPDLPRPPGVYRLPHWCIRRWPLLPSACSVLSPPAQLRRCLAHNGQ